MTIPDIRRFIAARCFHVLQAYHKIYLMLLLSNCILVFQSAVLFKVPIRRPLDLPKDLVYLAYPDGYLIKGKYHNKQLRVYQKDPS